MRNTEQKEFVDVAMLSISKHSPILDLGGGERFQKWLLDYKNLLENKDYRTMDFDENTKPDIVGDIHHIPLEDGSVGAVICSSVLEHVENPILATSEIRRVLKIGGEVFLYVPSIYPYHARKGAYADYWRFFDDTLELLFRNWKVVKIQRAGGYFRALSFFVPFQHKLRFILNPASNFLDKLFAAYNHTTSSGYYVHAIK